MKKITKSKASKSPKLPATRAKIKGKVEAAVSPDEPSAAELAAAEIEAKEALNGSPTTDNNGLGIWAQSPEKQERLRELIKLAPMRARRCWPLVALRQPLNAGRLIWRFLWLI